MAAANELANALREMEFEESLCCTSYALYNLLRSYPQTLFGEQGPSYEEFARGLSKMKAVGELPSRYGMPDRMLDGVSAGLGLKGEAAAVPRTEADLRKRLCSAGTGFIARLTLREAAGASAGARHSVIILPADADREMPHYNVMDSNGAVGALTKYSWKELSRMMCGFYTIEVHGPRRELGNAVAGFGFNTDVDRRVRENDVRDLLKVLAEFGANPVLGLESLNLAIEAHKKSALLRAFRASYFAAMAWSVGSKADKLREDPDTGDMQEARRDFEAARKLDPELAKSELPEALRSAQWDSVFGALASLAALSVAPKGPAAGLRDRVRAFLDAVPSGAKS